MVIVILLVMGILKFNNNYNDNDIVDDYDNEIINILKKIKSYIKVIIHNFIIYIFL